MDAVNPVKETIVRSEDFEYSEDFKQLHLVAIIYNKAVTKPVDLKREIEAYNDAIFSHLKLSVGQLEFDPKQQLGVLFINSFEDKKTVEAYHRALSRARENFSIEVDSNFNNFAISRDNFQMLMQSKELEAYLSFYKRFYQ